MGKTKKILSIFVILISLFTFNTDKVNAATGTITITSNKSQIVVGNTVIFTVTVTSPKEMVALQYDISYDKTIMTLTSGNTSDAPVFSGCADPGKLRPQARPHRPRPPFCCGSEWGGSGHHHLWKRP